MLRLIVRSILHPNIDRTIGLRTLGHRMPRVFVRSVTGCNDRLIVGPLSSVAGRHVWLYIDRWSLPQVARFPAMALAIDILHSFVIARPRVEIDRGMRPLLKIVENIADRSHLGPIATNRTIQKLYDSVWLWLKVVYSVGPYSIQLNARSRPRPVADPGFS